MTIARIPLAHPIASRTASTSKDSRSVNAMFETSGGERRVVKRPGLFKQNFGLPVAGGRGLFTWDEDIIVAQDTELYRVTGTLSTKLGNLLGTQPLSFAETAADAYLALHDGASFYYVDKATKTFTAPSGAVSAVNIDTAGGYYGYETACTVATGTPPTITATAHGLVVGQGVTFTATTLPAGITLGTTYQVASVPTADTFTINTATTGGGVGSAVAVTTTGTAVKFLASPTVTFSAGTVTAKGVATLYNHQVSGVIITTAGTYTSPPTVTFSAPAAVTSTATATVTAVNSVVGPGGGLYQIVTIGVATAGNGYFSAPTVTFPFVAGSGVYVGTGYATINSASQVQSISVVNQGLYNYNPLGAAVTLSAPPTPVTALGTVVMAAGGITGPFAYGMEYLDGYVFILTKAGRIYQSNLEDPTTWGALNYINVNADPDSAVALARQLNYLVAFGQWSTEVFYNAGNTSGSILGNNKSAKMEIGCASGGSVAKAEHTVIWMGQSKTEGRSIYLMEGLSPIKVSNRYIEKYLNKSNLSQVYSYCLKLSGHTCYVLTLEDLDITLVYDIDEKEWYQWTSQSGGVEGYFKFTAFNANIEYAPALYLQHHTDGQIYTMSTDAVADDTNNIYFRVVTNIQDSGTTKRKFYIRAEVVGDKVSGNAQIRHTSNDYQTWSTYRTVVLSLTRPILYQLGESRRRAWEILITDNIPVRLDALEVDFDVGEIGAS